MRSRHSKSIAVQSLGLLLTTYQGPNLGHARQMRCVQTADRAAPDDADSFHALASGTPLHLHHIGRSASFPVKGAKQAVRIVE